MRFALEFFVLFRAIRAGWSEPMFRALAVAVAAQLGFGAVVYMLVEGWTLVDALYFCVVASLTVGFGDLVPETNAGKLFTVIYLLPSVALYVAFGTQLASIIIEQRHQRMAARRGQRTEPPADEK